jgi:hypothetical protein
MNKPTTIANLVSGTFNRAVRESIVGVILMGVFAYEMQSISPGTPQYYGTILIIGSLGFIMGVLWSYVIGYHTLRIHPETDTTFWREAFQTQARLLRSVPLWYLAPILTGVMITALPSQSTSYAGFLSMLAVCGAIFAGLTWLNRFAAQKIEEQAQSFA